uniref:DUF4225 domain-containing protein n=1 Tax=Pseudomonas sp. TaxID=306 RepID=UPI002601B01D
AHGSNNMYESGRNLLEDRNDTEGLTRKAYQTIATEFNYSTRDGNMAYYLSDLGLSAYGLRRLIIKPGIFKLFRTIPTDYIMAYKSMGKGALLFETYIDYETLHQLHEEAKK